MKEPVIIHWLGEMFDPALDIGQVPPAAADHARWTWRRRHQPQRGVIAVDGVKVSLLDRDKEIAMRRRLDARAKMYTGDDFNYGELIAGDAVGCHALLGIFDAIVAGRCLRCADGAPRATRDFDAILSPPCRCRATFSRRRRASTRPAWCSWPGPTACRDHFVMVGGQQSARSILHLDGTVPPRRLRRRLRDPTSPVRACDTLCRRRNPALGRSSCRIPGHDRVRQG